MSISEYIQWIGDAIYTLRADIGLESGTETTTKLNVIGHDNTVLATHEETTYVDNFEIFQNFDIKSILKNFGINPADVQKFKGQLTYVTKTGRECCLDAHDVKYMFTPNIEDAYFATEEDGKKQAYPSMAELKKIYMAHGGKDGSKEDIDVNGTVKGGVTFHYAQKGDRFTSVSEKYKIEGGKKRLFTLTGTKDYVLSKTPELYFYVKQPEPPKVYKKLTKASLSQEVCLVVKSKQKIGTEIEIEIVEDGKYINDSKDTPISFQEITGTEEKPTKTEKKLYKVKLETTDAKGLNQGVIKLELAPKDEEELKSISDKFAPTKPKEIEKPKVFKPDFAPITDAEKDMVGKPNSKIFKMEASSKGLSSMASSVGIIGDYKNLMAMNNITTTVLSRGQVLYYREDSLVKTKSAFDKAEKARIDKLKKEQEEKLAKEKEKTTTLYIREKGGEKVRKSKFFLSLAQEIWSKSTQKKIDTLHPKIREDAKSFIIEVQNKGIFLLITSGYRDYTEQSALYQKGRIKNKDGIWVKDSDRKTDIVTNAKPGHSYHNFGLAFDVVEQKGKKLLWKKSQGARWKEISEIGIAYGFEWGGNFKSISDKPHFQKRFGLNTSELRQKIIDKKVKDGYVAI